jgi:hypothetical protein
LLILLSAFASDNGDFELISAFLIIGIGIAVYKGIESKSITINQEVKNNYGSNVNSRMWRLPSHFFG